MQNIRLEGYKGYEIVLYLWENVENAKGVVQISHGMAEHLERYDGFATFLNSKGYIVIGDDHRGHGKTAGETIGTLPDGDCFSDTMQDMHLITKFAKSRYDLPVFLLGHSYGSFLSQEYIQNYSKDIGGVILSGTAAQTDPILAIGNLIAKIQIAIFGKNKPGKFLHKMSFGSFNKEFKAQKMQNAWLSRDENIVRKYNEDSACGFVLPIEFTESMTRAFKRLYKGENLANIRKDLPILMIAGEKDPVGKCGKQVNRLADIYKSHNIEDVRVILYKDCRHEVLNELNKLDIYNDILTFLDLNTSA